MTTMTGIQFSATQSYSAVEQVSFSTNQTRTEDNETFKTEDQVNISYSAESSATYNSSMLLSAASDGGLQFLKDMIIDVFGKQGVSTTLTTDNGETDISSLDPAAAGELIAEDGYFGVEKTSERIFQFAIGIAGGDVTRLDAIREGVEQGFQEAKDAFGGWLPDISHDTYDAVMSKLDDWAESDSIQFIQT